MVVFLALGQRLKTNYRKKNLSETKLHMGKD
jgi:hypothetical protein